VFLVKVVRLQPAWVKHLTVPEFVIRYANTLAYFSEGLVTKKFIYRPSLSLGFFLSCH
jgi:hypothetical protein